MSRPSALRSRRARVLAPLAVTVTALSLIAAGCGGDDDNGGSQAGASGAAAADVASYVPAGAPVYLDVSTDLEGDQWNQIDTLSKMFPGLPQGVKAEIDKAVTEGGLDPARVKPLLGGRAAVAVLNGGSVGNVNGLDDMGDAFDNESALLVLDLADGKDAEAEALVDEQTTAEPSTVGTTKVYPNSDGDGYVAVVPGAILSAEDISTIQAAIDARAAGGDKVLSGNPRFTDAVNRLPEQTFATTYVDVGAFAQQAAAANPSTASAVQAIKDVRFVASAAAEPEGVRVKGVTLGGPAVPESASFTPTLTSNAPADALAYIGFRDLQGQVDNALKQYSSIPELQQLLSQGGQITPVLQQQLGITLDDLRALTAREHAVVVAKGSPIPGAALVLEVEDGARAGRTLDALREKGTALYRQQEPDAVIPEWRPEQLENGVSGWTLPLNPAYTVTYGVDGNKAIIGSNPSVVRTVQKPTSTLADSEDFRRATQGMPDKVTSVVWVNVTESVNLANGLGAFEDEPEAYANLQKVKSVSGWTTGGAEQTFEVFVRIG